jgi:hypothetical protein
MIRTIKEGDSATPEEKTVAARIGEIAKGVCDQIHQIGVKKNLQQVKREPISLNPEEFAASWRGERITYEDADRTIRVVSITFDRPDNISSPYIALPKTIIKIQAIDGASPDGFSFSVGIANFDDGQVAIFVQEREGGPNVLISPQRVKTQGDLSRELENPVLISAFETVGLDPQILKP